MDTGQLLLILIGSGGLGGLIATLTRTFLKWQSGASSRERIRNTSIESQRVAAIEDRDAANDRADKEALKRRKIEEYASRLSRQLIEAGITPAPWPKDTQSKE